MIRIDVVGDNALVAHLDRVPRQVESCLQESVLRQVLRLQRKVQAEKLSGQVLRVRTGTLRRSITERLIREPAIAITGIVSTNVFYGRLHEYGFDGRLSVKTHVRQIKQAWGKTLISPLSIKVAAHTRRAIYPEKSFLRTALKEIEPQLRHDIQQTLAQAIH